MEDMREQLKALQSENEKLQQNSKITEIESFNL
jgi:hypothetical protein